MSSKISQIKLQLARLLASFSAIKTDKAVLEYPEETEPYVGLEVYILVDDEYKPAEDGEYTLEDGRVFVIENGVITEIKEVVKEEFEEVPSPDGDEETPVDAIEELRKEVNELYNVVDGLIKKVSELESKIANTDSVVEKLSKEPAADPAEIDIQKPENKLDSRLKEMFNK